MKYRRLTRNERYQIQALITSGSSIRAIARQLKRSPSTICREKRKGLGKCGVYFAIRGQRQSHHYVHKPRLKMRKMRGWVKKYVQQKLLLDWSPEQIAGRMKQEKMQTTVSHQLIYLFLEKDKEKNGKFWKHLRIIKKGKHRNRPKGTKFRRIPDRVMIEKRPKIVERRNRLGDYERDTVLGKFNGSVLLTLVDRTSRKAKIVWLRKKCSKLVHDATVLRLKNEPLKTLTNDNGGEFSKHKKTSTRLGMAIFFAHSYHAWERGTNENFNGLLRQYFPKKQDIGHPTAACVKRIEDLLNNRPRKCLGYKTPNEVHKKLSRKVLR